MTAPLLRLHDEAPDGETAVQDTPVVVAVRRRTIDRVLIALGAVAAVVFGVAGGLLAWGNDFAGDYVHRELASQNITFPSAEALAEEGRTDLLKYADEQVTTGPEAEAYASFIDGHLGGIADGATYADLGAIVGEARDAVTAAEEAGASATEIADLEDEVASLNAQRDSLFRGETLRGLLLSTYAWGTIGQIAGIASIVAFVAAGVMAVLVAAGLVHVARARRTT